MEEKEDTLKEESSSEEEVSESEGENLESEIQEDEEETLEEFISQPHSQIITPQQTPQHLESLDNLQEIPSSIMPNESFGQPKVEYVSSSQYEDITKYNTDEIASVSGTNFNRGDLTKAELSVRPITFQQATNLQRSWDGFQNAQSNSFRERDFRQIETDNLKKYEEDLREKTKGPHESRARKLRIR